MSVKGISENLVAPQTNETNSLLNKFVGNSALLNNADATAVRFMTAQFVGNETRQDGLQQEAQKLIEKHTSKGWFGLSYLDNDALGKELAATIGTRPELAKAVFEQLGKTEIYTAQAMIDAAGDEQLTKAAQSEAGKQLLSQTKQAFADNIAQQKSWGELFSSKDKVAADEQRIQRIDRAISEAAKTGQTQEAQGTQDGTAQSEFPKVPEAKYTPPDIKRLFGDGSSYNEVDYWVNVISFREGNFSDAADVGDRAGLSVGLFQWTQKSGRLGELMQKYKDVAENSGKLEEFYQVFGGKEKAENLLAKLKNRSQAGSVSLSEIKPLFAEAAKHDVFKKAQIEAAREEAPAYIKLVAPYLPNSEADGKVSAKMLAAALVIKNIGGAKDDPSFVRKVMQRTTNELFDQVAANNPQVKQQLSERVAEIREQNKGLGEVQLKPVLAKETEKFKKEAVEKNVSQEKFIERLIVNAPKTLYTTPWKYTKYHNGVENRIRLITDSIPVEQKTNPK